MASTSPAGGGAGAVHDSPPPPPQATAPLVLFHEMGPDLAFADPAIEASFRAQHNRAQRHFDMRAAAAAHAPPARAPPDCPPRPFM
jgi:hypothetical protein